MLNAANSLPADVTNGTDDSYKYYLGLAETSFKNIYRKYIHLLIMSNKKIKQNCLSTFGLLKMRENNNN